MADLYNTALALFDAGTDWTNAGADYRILLIKNAGLAAFDATHATVAAVLATSNDECNHASYARYTIPDADRTMVSGTRKRQFHMINPADFGALTSETVGAALLFKFITNDADSLPIAWLTSANFPLTANGAGFTLTQGANGLFEIEGV